MNLTVQVAGRSDVGCVRTNNEDNFGYDWRYGIYVVCDGMGGQAAGEVASKMAVDVVLDYFRRAAKEKKYPAAGRVYEGVSERASALASAIQLANQAIHEAAVQDPRQTGMGSTITAVLVDGREYSIAHVGDSRIYLIRPPAPGAAADAEASKATIQQLTADHSLVMEQVRRGLITMEEAQRSEMQNIIIRALGSEETVEPDLSDLVAQPGDMLLLASDGLMRHVPDDKILAIVTGTQHLREACDKLIEAAKQGGGTDNVTCLLLRFVEKSWVQNVFGGSPGEGSARWQNSM
ncbi:MAG: Stp1/IreP family PP2C-type Ser/Thr phosphatase [Terriglobales bacterium]